MARKAKKIVSPLLTENLSGVAALYVRYSSQNNIYVVEIYEDKAVTGKTDRRYGFQRMMRDAEKGLFNVVIAYKSNRISRNMMHALSCESKLDDFGVKLLYAKEEFGNNAAGRFALRSMMNVNQFYSENMAEDILRGLNDNAEKGLVTGALPFGYVVDKETKKPIVIEERAAVVREIFDKFLSGISFAEIARDLNARAITTGSGSKWNKGSFHNMMRNERYTGVYIYKDVRTEEGYPVILDRDTWLIAQERLLKKKNPMNNVVRRSAEYLLTGKLFCGHCSAPMVGMSGTSKTGAKHYYYGCQGRRVEKKCRKKHVNRDYIEEVVCTEIAALLHDDKTIEWMADTVMAYQESSGENSALKILNTQRRELKKSLKNMCTAIEQGLITPTTKSRLEELEVQLVKAERDIALEKASQFTITRERLIYYYEQFRRGDVNDPIYRQTILRMFVNAIFLYDDHLKITFDYTDREVFIDLTKLENPDVSGDSGDFGDGSKGSCKFPSPPPIKKNSQRLFFFIGVRLRAGIRHKRLKCKESRRHPLPALPLR